MCAPNLEHLSKYLNAKGNHEYANLDYIQAIELNPNLNGAYMNKGVVIKGKIYLRICFTGVLIILSYLLFSCATTTTDKSKGTWEHQPGTFTYINPELHIKLTFPNEEWKIFTGPEKSPTFVKKSWKKYKSDHETYHGLIAINPGGDGIIMHLKIIPPEQPLFKEELEDMIAGSKDGLEMAFQLHGIQIQCFESKVIQRQNKRIGVAECQYYSPKDFTLLFTAMKEIDRYIAFEFYCLKDYYTLKKNEFWNIIDSYERFYKPGYGQTADTEPKELVTGKKYIKIEEPDSVFAGGKVKYNLIPGDFLEVIRKKTCLGGKGECWEVKNIKTGETGFVNAERMKNRHYVYTKE